MKRRTSDPLDCLLAHNLWATRLILDRCRAISDEQFRRPFPIGPADHGGLCAILTHIVGAMRRWADRVAGREIRPPIEPWRPGHQPCAPSTPDQLRALLDEAHADLSAVIAAVRRQGEPGLAHDVVLSFKAADGDKSISFTSGASIASAAVHGHYHRAQCMNILRQLGAPTASIDVIDWQLAEEGA
jgi:uncharacterized damage-inducible protein DinB